jgi:hypothetical protein
MGVFSRIHLSLNKSKNGIEEIMTSNRPLEDRGKLVGDVPSATAILDRFLHHAELISITGRSYRLQRHGMQGHSPTLDELAATAPDAGSAETPQADPKPAKAPSGSSRGMCRNNPQPPHDPNGATEVIDCQA